MIQKMILLCVVIVLAYIFYTKLIRSYTYWKERGVKHEKPIIFFGSVFDNVVQRVSFPELLQNLYNRFSEERYFGIYQFMTPTLVINDPDLIKQIGIQDFNHFPNHQLFSKAIDPLWSKTLFTSMDDKWRDMRSNLTPSFTSSKMKGMFNILTDCSEKFVNYFMEKDEDVVTVEMKDIFTRFANDVIASCAFGVQCDSLRDRENEFYRRGFDASNFGGIKIFGFTVSPTLMKFLKVRVISERTANFFRKIIDDTIKMRNIHGTVRADMIHILMEARKVRQQNDISLNSETVENPSKLLIAQDDITAQALGFFIGGFETSSTLMVYIAYELTANRDVQDKLLEEVDETFLQCNGHLRYDVLWKMKYLDMVVSECLRKWPPNVLTDRVCTQDYTIQPQFTHEKPLTIQKGDQVWFPIYAMHRDPKYFPEPEKFDPERFSEDNKDKITPNSYIPFGIGPRACIASRFAQLETKAIIFHILTKFEFVPVKKTVIPVQLCKRKYNLNATGGMWLGLKRRISKEQFGYNNVFNCK